MLEGQGACVLEIARQDNKLVLSIFERSGPASTVKHYSELSVSIPRINSLCQEVIRILNKANRKASREPDLIEQLKKTGLLLWDELLSGQIKDKLADSAIKELILSLDENLIDIPWELLYDGKDFLCLKFSLGRVVRTKDRLPRIQYRNASPTLKMLVLANPTGDLNSAYREGRYIRNRFDRKRRYVKIDFKSTSIDTLYVKKSLRDYDIVHFAGHCEYDTVNPKNNGWILSDGKFTTEDILALAQSQSLPSLVFSNACSSAKVAIDVMDADYQEKTYSLAAAFLFSGVRHYIGTIWRVKDPTSILFAQEFYNYLIRGRSIGESVRLGRLKLIKEYGIADISWASYILYGDPNFILFKPTKFELPLSRIKKSIRQYKRYIQKPALLALVVFAGVFLYGSLPAKNPSSYFLFLKAGELFRKGKNNEVISLSKNIVKKDPLFLSAYPLLAGAYERLGDRQNSLKYYFEYAFSAQKRHNAKKLISAYVGIGWVYQLFGEYDKALDFYNKAVALSRESRDKLNEALALRKLAVWHIDKGNYDKALELLMKSLEINRDKANSNEQRYNLACDYFDIGLVFANKDDFESAREFYKKSRVLFEKMKLKYELSDYYFNLGELYLFEKQYNKALDYYLKGLSIDEASGNRPAVAGDYNMLGELHMEMGNFIEAEKLFLKAASICQKIGLLPELTAVKSNLSLLYKQKQGNE